MIFFFCEGFKSWFRSTDQHVSIMHISLSFLVQFLEIVTINIQAIRDSELRSTFGHISPDITYVFVLSHVFPCVHSFKFIYSFTIWCVIFEWNNSTCVNRNKNATELHVCALAPSI